MASFEELLQCSVCLERFTSPKALPCLHTFCLSCLKGIIKDAKTLNCPTCRKTHPVPEQGATGFLDNLVIVNLLDMVGESTTCSDCGEKQTLSDCEHCGEELCADCRVAHNRLETRLSMLLNLILNNLRNKSDADEEIARAELERILEAEANIHKAFDEAMDAATATLTKRRDELLHKLQTLAKFQKAIVENQEEVVVCTTHNELCTHLSISSLEKMEKSLSMVEEIMSNDEMDLNEFGRFGEVSIEGENLASRSEGTKQKSGTGEQSVTEPPASVQVSSLPSGAAVHIPNAISAVEPPRRKLPGNVDYKAKQPLWKLVIATPAEGCEEFKPTCAVYSSLEDAMYCLSKGDILRYDARSGVGKIACSIFEAKHMALTESGSLILIDDSHIVKITAYQLENPKNDGFDFALTNLPAGTNATQVGCYSNEVIVLDSAKRRFLRFSEEGKLINEIKPEGVYVSEASSMCVDHEGRIYVSHVSIVNRRDCAGVFNQCHKEPDSVYLTWQWVVSILSVDGTAELVIDNLTPRVTETFRYPTFEEMCPFGCGRNHSRIDRARACENEITHVTNVRPISAMCVDADECISITKPGQNQIYVYNPHGIFLCCIGDFKRPEFKEPTGLSLMPDGRLVVCDTGNNKITIM